MELDKLHVQAGQGKGADTCAARVYNQHTCLHATFNLDLRAPLTAAISKHEPRDPQLLSQCPSQGLLRRA